MLKLLFSLLMLPVLAQAVITPSPTSYRGYKLVNRPDLPHRQTFAITTSPTGCTSNLSVTGTGIGAFVGFTDPATGSTVTSVAHGSSFRMTFSTGIQGWSATTPGTYQATVTLTGTGACAGQTAQIVLEIVLVRPFAWGKAVGPETGCVNSNALYIDLDSCTVVGEYPYDTGFTWPAVGSTITDPNFGTTIRTLTTGPQRWVQSYTSLEAINSNSTKALIGGFKPAAAGGWTTTIPHPASAYNSAVIDLTTGAMSEIAGIGSAVASGAAFWHPTDPNIFYSVTALGVVSRWEVDDLAAGPTTVANLGDLETGGANGLSTDGYYGYHRDSTEEMCIARITTISVGQESSHRWCASSVGLLSINGGFVTDVDSETGKRYLLSDSGSAGGGNVAIYMWSLTETPGTLTFEGRFPEYQHQTTGIGDGDGICEASESCISSTHIDYTKDFNGRVYIVYPYGPGGNFGNRRYMSAYQLSKILQPMGQYPQEVGGGLRLLAPTNHTDQGGATHFGGTATGTGSVFVSMGNLFLNSQLYAGVRLISSATVDGTEVDLVLNSAQVHPDFTVGEIIAIGSAMRTDNVNAYECLNGRFTVTAKTDINNITVDANCSAQTGTYAASSGLVARRETHSWGHRNTHYMVNNFGDELRKIAGTRGIGSCYKNGSNACTSPFEIWGYWQIPRASVSRNGDLIVWTADRGEPGQLQVQSATTNWSAASRLKITTNVGITTALVRIKAAQDVNTCTVEYSTNADLTSSATAASLTTGAYHTIEIPSLTAGTLYYARAHCPTTNPEYARRFQFTTAPTAVGNTVVQINTSEAPVAADDVIVEYGTTSSLGSTSTPKACAAGASCIAQISVAKGLIYTQWKIRNSSDVVIATGPLSRVAVN
jgi:hypothetical protein